MADIFSEDFLNSLDIPLNFNLSEFLMSENKSDNFSDSQQEVGNMENNDEKQYDKALLNYYLMGIAGSTVCIVGTLCNILSVVVLTQRVMNSSTYSYLAALAVCDTLALLLTVFIFLLSEDTVYPHKGTMTWVKPSYAILFPYLHPAAITFQVTSIWLTLAFTVDRYIMICHPFRAERLCSVSRARKVIVFIYILGLIFNIPRFLEYTTKEISIPALNGKIETRKIVQYTEIGQKPIFIDIVHSYLYLTCVCGIPFLTLAILNTFLIYAVHLSKKKGKLINAKEKKRNDTTLMLIGVIVIFLVCQGPALISRMVYAFDFHLATASFTFHRINEVGNFLIIVNSAINIVPYYFFGKRFRKEFWRVFCACFLTNHELRKMKRNLSFSVDKRRLSQCSGASQYELNGFHKTMPNHRDSNSPLLHCPDKVHRDSVHTTDTLDIERRSPYDANVEKHGLFDVPGDRLSPCSFDRVRRESPTLLKIVWEMDNNKNDKSDVPLKD
ncbi:FMRFamide receptor-like [Mya arenaria]|uniref:FMRFamide receptor-like n=1 Tax=Mya arenaria TaxID=6604 RepID=UPI0022E6BC04|nr:FMRFamide receptor-like [Mya arenaria]